MSTRENPQANWMLASRTRYNQFIRDVTFGAIVGVVISLVPGAQVAMNEVAQTFATGVIGGRISGSMSATLWAEKTVFYKLNTSGNGYPYYCQEIVEVWVDSDFSDYAYTTSIYFYSYQPY